MGDDIFDKVILLNGLVYEVGKEHPLSREECIYVKANELFVRVKFSTGSVYVIPMANVSSLVYVDNSDD